MDKFIESLKLAIESENWYATLIIALTLPDICSKYHTNQGKSEARYTTWFNEFLLEKYTSHVGPNHEKHIFLSGSDCYALRCALVHEGSDTIAKQKAWKALDNFHFVVPPSSGLVHMNQSDNTLQLQIDIFSNDVLDACENWWNSLGSPQQAEVNKKLLIVHQSFNF